MALKNKISKNWIWIILAVSLVAIILIINSGKKIETQEIQTPVVESGKLDIGEEGVINFREDKSDCSGEDKIVLGITKEDQDKIGKALSAEDWMGITELISIGKAFSVGICTKAKVIDRAMFLRQVRILEGENIGKSGWLPYEWIK
ncbi:MAG: hypothetical protein ACKKMS_00070 [Candidatus Nealsonbacteria bacterium]